MRKFILIKVDYNDADYNEELNEITQEQLDKIIPLIEAIKNNPPNGHNFEARNFEGHGRGINAREYYVGNNFCTENSFEILYGFCPFNEYGFHSIESIKIFEVSDVKTLVGY